MFEIFSAGRAGPQHSGRFSRAQIEQIVRTVRRTPEVMVKVTGGGAKVGAVSAHLNYISRQGRLEIETDEGERITSRDEHKALLKDWHLELSAGQYRRQNERQPAARTLKLVHNIVLSMPAPTPPQKVLAAARKFAQEKFALRHRYVMALHTDQKHPHVHLVVKCENEFGRRLHIDKPLLREWREDFARMMRDQGIAANATARIVRGRNKGRTQDALYRAQQHGKSSAIRERVMAIAQELSRTGAVRDPAHSKLVEIRKAVVSNWMKTADALDAQGEIILASDVRDFANHLPPVLTDKEKLAGRFIRYIKMQRPAEVDGPVKDRAKEHELVR
jgi:Relaxase/Mobilisation nuclease domain